MPVGPHRFEVGPHGHFEGALAIGFVGHAGGGIDAVFDLGGQPIEDRKEQLLARRTHLSPHRGCAAAWRRSSPSVAPTSSHSEATARADTFLECNSKLSGFAIGLPECRFEHWPLCTVCSGGDTAADIFFNSDLELVSHK